VVGSQVKDDVRALHGHTGDAGFPQIGLDELNAAGGQVLLDVLQFAAGEVIHDPYFGAPLKQGVYQMGTDE
jgi:hypothetical protein